MRSLFEAPESTIPPCSGNEPGRHTVASGTIQRPKSRTCDSSDRDAMGNRNACKTYAGCNVPAFEWSGLMGQGGQGDVVGTEIPAELRPEQEANPGHETARHRAWSGHIRGSARPSSFSRGDPRRVAPSSTRDPPPTSPGIPRRTSQLNLGLRFKIR
jgi:hypothetical protein